MKRAQVLDSEIGVLATDWARGGGRVACRAWAWGLVDRGLDARCRVGRGCGGAGADALGGGDWGFAGRFRPIGRVARRDAGALAQGAAGLRVMECGSGEGAGLPEQDELFQAVEDAREDGGDEGVHGVRQPGTGLPGRNGSVEVGDLCAKRG